MIANAVCSPAVKSEYGISGIAGGPSRYPVTDASPDAASVPNPIAPNPLHGPVWPYPVDDTMMMSGLTFLSSSYSSPKFLITLGVKFSANTSLTETSSSSALRPSGLVRSSVKLNLFRFCS